MARVRLLLEPRACARLQAPMLGHSVEWVYGKGIRPSSGSLETPEIGSRRVEL